MGRVGAGSWNLSSGCPSVPDKLCGKVAASLSSTGWSPLGLTAPPFPGWRLPLLGQRYLDLLTTWYCSFKDCCPRGDCRISNNFTGWTPHGFKGLGICGEGRQSRGNG